MSPGEAIAIVSAGGAAGALNAVVGSGTLITFPVLLAFGYAPVVANVSNTVGLAVGSISGVHGYRAELVGQRSRLIRFGTASATGGIVGSILLLALPAAAFDAIVPVFIALGLLLVVVQPLLTRRLVARSGALRTHGGVALFASLFGVGVYGGYFGAGQGIVLLAVLGASLAERLQRINALKNALAMLTNMIAGVVFVFAADVDWLVAALLACGSLAGGQLGARVGRALPPPVLRGLVVLVGLSAIAKLVA